VIFLKHIFLLAVIFALLSINSFSAQKDGQVYRWVDKKGVVHYADKPKNKHAVLVNIKEVTANSFIESDLELSEIVKAEEITDENVLSQEDQEYCDYLKQQIKLAEEAVEVGNELRANYASAYLNTSDKLLKDNRCL